MFQRHHDELPYELTRRNRDAQRLAWRLGLAPRPSRRFGTEDVPVNLCQRRVAEERELATERVRDFVDALEAGGQVIFVTVCRPEWTCAEGQLSPERIAEVRHWMSRRARNLARLGQQRMIGFVDIAWNERASVGKVSHWSVHAHCLIYVEDQPNIRAEVRTAFRCTSDNDRVLKPVVVKSPSSDLDVLRISYYNSRSLLLEHQQQRRSYRDAAGVAQTRDAKLATKHAVELASVVNQVGPQSFWILSGYRRKFGKIVKHDHSRAF